MNLTISNLAWNFDEILEFSTEIKKLGINKTELVFSKFEKWETLTENKVIELKNILEVNGIIPTSVQSLFYGVDCTSIIEDKEKFLQHIEKLIKFSKILEIKILVFGSPSLRKKRLYIKETLNQIFVKVDELLKKNEILLCIEPNAKKYGGEFFHSTYEIIDFLKENKFSNIFTMLDTHNSTSENIDYIEELEKNFEFIKHIHISESNLVPLKDFDKHYQFSQKIKSMNYSGFITYEVLNFDGVINSIKDFTEIYR